MNTNKGHVRSINSPDMRLKNRWWGELSSTEQKCVAVASSLSHDSSFIPLIASEIAGYLLDDRIPEHPQPEYSI